LTSTRQRTAERVPGEMDRPRFADGVEEIRDEARL
jgi:hypothetical protein